MYYFRFPIANPQYFQFKFSCVYSSYSRPRSAMGWPWIYTITRSITIDIRYWVILLIIISHPAFILYTLSTIPTSFSSCKQEDASRQPCPGFLRPHVQQPGNLFPSELRYSRRLPRSASQRDAQYEIPIRFRQSREHPKSD